MLDRPHIWALCAALALFPALAGAQSPIHAFPPGTFQNHAAIYGGNVTPPAYTYLTSVSSVVAGSNVSQSVALGANATCTAIVAISGTTSSPTFTASVGGVSLTQQVISTASSRSVAIFSGALASCSGSQTVAVTTNVSTYSYRAFSIWVATNLVSSTPAATSSYTLVSGTKTPSSPTISVTAGNLMFAQNYIIAGTNGACAGSSVAPTGERDVTIGTGSSADWLIASTNASFVTNCDPTVTNNGAFVFGVFR